MLIDECRQPFGRMGIGRMMERAGEAAGLSFPVHVHILRHSTGYAALHASITNTLSSLVLKKAWFFVTETGPAHPRAPLKSFRSRCRVRGAAAERVSQDVIAAVFAAA